MSLQQMPPGHQYGPITVAGGAAHLGDQYITIHQNEENRQELRWQQLLASLKFAEMNARYNEIRDTQYETFEWVFHQVERDDPVQQPSLANWFKEQHGTYLIQGKAGSGKSTFMKFLSEHPKTTILLREWAAGRGLLMLFHSFWLVGTNLQHNFKGLLANLMYQIAQVRPEVVAHYCAPRPLKTSLNDWSEKDLRGAMLHCVQASEFSVCIFLDGLDEFDHSDDVERLFRLVSDVEAASGAAWKFCISTRPIQYILDQFKFVPATKLHELTAADIRKYATTTLEEISGLGRYSDGEMDNIIHLICHKADGVFLWVYYALRNVCKGLRIEDEYHHLLQRLEDLPSAIEDLYQRMWQVHNADNAIHAGESRRLFRLVYTFQAYHQDYRSLSLFQLFIATEPYLRAEYLASLETLDEDHLEMLSLRFARKVGSHSAGLIECIAVAHPGEICDHQSFQRDLTGIKFDIVPDHRPHWRDMKIQFIHRTVLDFLTDTIEGRSIAGLTESLCRKPLRALLEARLVCFIEGVLPLSLEELIFLSRDMGPIQWEDIDFIDIFDKTTMGLLRKRLGPATTAVSAWMRLKREFVRNSETRFGTAECRDFPGLIVAYSESVLCVKYLLATRGHGWTGYYKGHLFLLAFSSVRGPRPSPDRLEPMALLQDAGADLTTQQTFCYHNQYPVITKSPATEILSYLVSNLLFDGWSCPYTHTELASWKDLADAYLKHTPTNGHVTFVRDIDGSAAVQSQPPLSSSYVQSPLPLSSSYVLTTLNASKLRHVVIDILDGTEREPQWWDRKKALLATLELVHVSQHISQDGELGDSCHSSRSGIARCSPDEGLYLANLVINASDLNDGHRQKLKEAFGEIDASRFIPSGNPQFPIIPDIGYGPSVQQPCTLLPLNPYQDIGPHNWRTEATKRIYHDELDQHDDCTGGHDKMEPDSTNPPANTPPSDDLQVMHQETVNSVHDELCTQCRFHDSVD